MVVEVLDVLVAVEVHGALIVVMFDALLVVELPLTFIPFSFFAFLVCALRSLNPSRPASCILTGRKGHGYQSRH